ncbi:YbaK/EbsC family protein [Balneolaceae bacterium YR4-1]|uniref:YbaK/EbsC family protein n=1 Tax=Halalkalibaculum roseum TaxID=2709311 RepID=A0A6M1STP7_9BACT|nr:YbaK/EbsC family protein [Halalkalibaculum roseum]NGP75468.1 YbaK/EbsC family protein [Halalkalibaculum roseum]
MKDKLSKNAQRVQDALNEHGFEFKVQELPDSTRSAQDAAKAIGCSVPQIAKSIIFRSSQSKNPVLAIVSGSNRADVKKIASHLDEAIEIANADYVKEHTGFPIGGVSPIGHKSSIQTFIDEDLLEFNEIWAAAGTPHAVFKLESKTLPALTNGIVIDLKE